MRTSERRSLSPWSCTDLPLDPPPCVASYDCPFNSLLVAAVSGVLSAGSSQHCQPRVEGSYVPPLNVYSVRAGTSKQKLGSVSLTKFEAGAFRVLFALGTS